MTEYLELWVLGLLAAVAGLVMLSNRLGGALSGLPRPRRARVGPYSRRARDQATAGSGPLDLPPAAPVLGGLLLLSARPQGKPEADSVPSIGLVLLTTLTVASVAHLLVGLPWAAAFVLGAIVSPTDPVAATAIAGRLGAPRRIVTILEGESLINDGTALVLYSVAVSAVVTGTFSLPKAGLEFILYGTGGTVIGLVVG